MPDTILLLYESSAASLESGLLSDWSKNKRAFEPRSMIACLATVEGDADTEFSAALTMSLDDFIHK